MLTRPGNFSPSSIHAEAAPLDTSPEHLSHLPILPPPSPTLSLDSSTCIPRSSCPASFPRGKTALLCCLWFICLSFCLFLKRFICFHVCVHLHVRMHSAYRRQKRVLGPTQVGDYRWLCTSMGVLKTDTGYSARTEVLLNTEPSLQPLSVSFDWKGTFSQPGTRPDRRLAFGNIAK